MQLTSHVAERPQRRGADSTLQRVDRGDASRHHLPWPSGETGSKPAQDHGHEPTKLTGTVRSGRKAPISATHLPFSWTETADSRRQTPRHCLLCCTLERNLGEACAAACLGTCRRRSPMWRSCAHSGFATRAGRHHDGHAALPVGLFVVRHDMIYVRISLVMAFQQILMALDRYFDLPSWPCWHTVSIFHRCSPFNCR